MPVSLNQFSDIAARQDVRDSGVVRLDNRQELRPGQSRFRLVRWIRDSGIGKRISNRRTVDAFIGSLQNHYGAEVTKRMDLGPLRDLQRRGKPLHVRDIKAAISEADQAADLHKLAQSSKIETMVDEKVNQAAYLAEQGGRALADEVRSRVDLDGTYNQFAGIQNRRSERAELSGDFSLFTANRLAGQALENAAQDIFLTGYGVETARGRQSGRLQQIFDQHPQAQAVYEKYGLRFDAARMSDGLYGGLTKRLQAQVNEGLDNPERLPGNGTVKERIEQAVNDTAEQIVDDFVRESTEALEQLHGMRDRGAIKPEDLALFDTESHHSLADVVLHHRILPAMVPKLYELRSKVPANQGALADTGRSMEDKIQVLRGLGDVIAEATSGLSGADAETFAHGNDDRNGYLEGCGRFLLEGKLSAEDDSAIRVAARNNPPGSNLRELCQGIADMRDEIHKSPPPGEEPQSSADRAEAQSAPTETEAQSPPAGTEAQPAPTKKEAPPPVTIQAPDFWKEAREPVGNMADAAIALLGRDAPASTGSYTRRAGAVAEAIRNCGIGVPPPDESGIEQSGKGSFNQSALQIARQELVKILDENKDMSTEFPGYIEEAAKDLQRATFVFNGKALVNEPKIWIYEGFKEFCVDRQGNPDDRLFDVLTKLAYQRSNTLALRRFAAGAPDIRDSETGKIEPMDKTDRGTILTTAPLVGIPSAKFKNSYNLSKTADGNVNLVITFKGPSNALNHGTRGALAIDYRQSHVEMNIHMEIDTQDYSVRLTGMDYDYRLVPSHKGLEMIPEDWTPPQ